MPRTKPVQHHGWPLSLSRPLCELEEWESVIQAAKETHRMIDEDSTIDMLPSLDEGCPAQWFNSWLRSASEIENAVEEQKSLIVGCSGHPGIAKLFKRPEALATPAAGSLKRPLEYEPGQWAGQYQRHKSVTRRRRTFLQTKVPGLNSERYTVTMQETILSALRDRLSELEITWISMLERDSDDNYFSWAFYRVQEGDRIYARAAVNSEGGRFCEALSFSGSELDNPRTLVPDLRAPWQIPDDEPPSVGSVSTQ